MPARSSTRPAAPTATACPAARWLRTTGLGEIGRETIRREALSFAVDADGAERVLERLTNAGILRPQHVVASRKGGRPTRRWKVNPALLKEGLAQ